MVTVAACGGTVGASQANQSACERYFAAVLSHQQTCGDVVRPFGIDVLSLSAFNHDSFVALCEGLLATSNGATPDAVDGLDSCAASLSSCSAPTDCASAVGSRALASSCLFDWQCDSGLCAGGSSPQMPGPACGVCASPIAAADPCSVLQDACAQGLECAQTTGTCTPLLGFGGSCGSDLFGDNCDPGLGLACGPVTSLCDPAPSVGQDCTSSCSGGAVCQPTTTQTDGVYACVAAKSLGDACDFGAFYSECDPFLACGASGTCEVWNPTICD
jgi:hypothetical protein